MYEIITYGGGSILNGVFEAIAQNAWGRCCGQRL
jgi:hypothetical protein